MSILRFHRSQMEARRSSMSDSEYREANARIQAAAGNDETKLPPRKQPSPVNDEKFESEQVLFKCWRPEMGLPSVKPECWSNPEWAKAVALRPERYATPRWVRVLVGVITLGVAGAEGVKTAWDIFREGYENAYENAKRASAESNNGGTNSSRPSDPNKPRRSPYDVLGVHENAPWSEVKSAYRKLMMDLHPDRVSQTGRDPRTATARTQEVNAGYVELENQRFAS
jgi:DnaJ domain